MRKLFAGLAAALAAAAIAALCREESHYGPGYAQLATCPLPPNDQQSIALPKEMIEIQRGNHLVPEIKVHLKNPFLGDNCYVGSTNSSHEQNQLRPLLA